MTAPALGSQGVLTDELGFAEPRPEPSTLFAPSLIAGAVESLRLGPDPVREHALSMLAVFSRTGGRRQSAIVQGLIESEALGAVAALSGDGGASAPLRELASAVYEMLEQRLGVPGPAGAEYNLDAPRPDEDTGWRSVPLSSPAPRWVGIPATEGELALDVEGCELDVMLVGKDRRTFLEGGEAAPGYPFVVRPELAGEGSFAVLTAVDDCDRVALRLGSRGRTAYVSLPVFPDQAEPVELGQIYRFEVTEAYADHYVALETQPGWVYEVITRSSSREGVGVNLNREDWITVLSAYPTDLPVRWLATKRREYSLGVWSPSEELSIEFEVRQLPPEELTAQGIRVPRLFESADEDSPIELEAEYVAQPQQATFDFAFPTRPGTDYELSAVGNALTTESAIRLTGPGGENIEQELAGGASVILRSGSEGLWQARLTEVSSLDSLSFQVNAVNLIAAAPSRDSAVPLEPGTEWRVSLPAGTDQWMRLAAERGTYYEISTLDLSGNSDTVLELYSGDEQLATDDDSGGGRASAIWWRSDAGGELLIKASDYGGSASSFDILVKRFARGAGAELPFDGLFLGDEVILGRHTPIDGDDNWVSDMDAFIDKRATITHLWGREQGLTGPWVVSVDIDDGAWSWRTRDMKRPPAGQ